MVLFETGRLIHRPALPSRLITQGRFPFPTSSPSISHFSPSSVSNFSPPLRIPPSCRPLPPPPPIQHHHQAHLLQLTAAPLPLFTSLSHPAPTSLSRRITSSLVTAVFFVPLSLSLSLSSGQTAEGGSPWAATNYSFPSIPSPCCQKRLQKRQIRRLKNTFCFLLSRCSNFITSQQILGRTY